MSSGGEIVFPQIGERWRLVASGRVFEIVSGSPYFDRFLVQFRDNRTEVRLTLADITTSAKKIE